MSELAIYSALAAMDMGLKKQTALAKNLAALNIPGYKGEHIVEETFDTALKNATSENISAFCGPAVGSVTKIDFTQGVIEKTHRPLDFSIQGKGFFEIMTPTGQRLYTRNGSFHLSKDGYLVTDKGFSVNGVSGKIKFDVSKDVLENMEVTADGYIRIRDAKTPSSIRELGQLKIVDIEDKSKLIRVSASCYVVKPEDIQYVKTLNIWSKKEKQNPYNFKVENCSLERSNVSPVTEMIEMLDNLRRYEIAQKVIKANDSLAEKTISKYSS